MSKTILIAEDDHGFRVPITDMFIEAGFQVVEAVSEGEVLERATQADIWIIDVRLPYHREGINSVIQLVEDGCRPEYPVIFISVNPEDEAKEQLASLSEKNIQYVWDEKPFEPELLLNRVQEFLRENSP